jgi:hypothetical protein
VDTNQWLEVTGTVRVERAMVLIEAATLAVVGAPADAPQTTAVEIRQGPRPEVIFSTPVADDVDIDRDVVVRVQFSRDIDAATLDGHVQIAYPTGPSPDPAAAPEVLYTLAYRGLNRVLEIQFDEPLEPFRILQIQLLEGILATDGAPLVPWTLSFQLGS